VVDRESCQVTTLDWILVAVLGLSLLMGVWRGLVFEVLSVMGWVAAFFAAQWLGPALALRLPLDSLGDAARSVLAYTLTFVLAVFAAGLLASLVRKLVAVVGLRPVDRVLGAAFGLVRGLVILLAATVALEMTSFKTADWWRQSPGAALLSVTLAGLKPALPEGFARFLN
jgi:membrane protein required for colicin V production